VYLLQEELPTTTTTATTTTTRRDFQYTRSGAFLATEDPNEWLLAVDSGELDPGLRYRLCTDLDGSASPELRSGHTGLEVFLSPVVDLAPTSLAAMAAHSLALTCRGDWCAKNASRGFLAAQCSGWSAPDNATCSSASTATLQQALASGTFPSSPASSLEALGGDLFGLQVNGSCLTPGRYRLCLLLAPDDPDGDPAEAEDSGWEVTVSPSSAA